VGATVLSVFGNAVTLMLTNWLGVTSSAAFKIALGALLVFFLSVWVLAKGLRRLRPQVLNLSQHPRPAKRKGLILLVSRAETSRAAIAYHQPMLERCWLLCSTRSLPLAQAMCHEFDKIEFSEPIVVNDVNDPLEFRARVSEVYEKLPAGWSDEDVIGDYTGMTAHGSVGMVLASLAPHRPLQYTPAHYDEQLKATEPLDPIEIVLDWEVGPDRKSPSETRSVAVSAA
jgi:hypothetical protein